MGSPASAIREFDRTMIAAALRTNDLSFTEDGNFYKVLLPLEPIADQSPDVSRTLTGLFSADEPSDKVYVAQFTGAVLPKEAWGEGLHMCHEWNSQIHLVTASFRRGIPHPEQGEVGVIVLRAALDLSAGVHQAFVDDFTIEACAEALNFWEDATAKEDRAAAD